MMLSSSSRMETEVESQEKQENSLTSAVVDLFVPVNDCHTSVSSLTLQSYYRNMIYCENDIRPNNRVENNVASRLQRYHNKQKHSSMGFCTTRYLNAVLSNDESNNATNSDSNTPHRNNSYDDGEDVIVASRKQMMWQELNNELQSHIDCDLLRQQEENMERLLSDTSSDGTMCESTKTPQPPPPHHHHLSKALSVPVLSIKGAMTTPLLLSRRCCLGSSLKGGSSSKTVALQRTEMFYLKEQMKEEKKLLEHMEHENDPCTKADDVAQRRNTAAADTISKPNPKLLQKREIAHLKKQMKQDIKFLDSIKHHDDDPCTKKTRASSHSGTNIKPNLKLDRRASKAA